MKIVIVGGGKKLYFLCRSLISKGYDLSIINNNNEECKNLARQLRAKIVYGDGSDLAVLKEAGIMEADTILAITDNGHNNFVICQLASIEFSVPRVIALAMDPDNVKIFEDLGVTSFSTNHLMSSVIEQRTSEEQITNLFPICEGNLNVTEVYIGKDSSMIGKSLKGIILPESAFTPILIRNNKQVIYNDQTELNENDRIILITTPENHGSVLKSFEED